MSIFLASITSFPSQKTPNSKCSNLQNILNTNMMLQVENSDFPHGWLRMFLYEISIHRHHLIHKVTKNVEWHYLQTGYKSYMKHKYILFLDSDLILKISQ